MNRDGKPGSADPEILSPDQFPFARLKRAACQSRPAGNPRTRKSNRPRFKDCICAFDIETTRVPDIEQSFMYIWQWAFWIPQQEQLEPLWCVVVGRTWEEYLWFTGMLQKCLNAETKLCCWVHNLSFEFAFLRGIWRFAPDDVFAIQPRKILKACQGGIEFRCSYLHSNMSLDEYTSKMGVEHKKRTYDYDKIRYPWTPMTDEEIAYCINDVVGLVEALRIEMAADNDSLYTVPITSTGYVRRDAKRAMREVSYNYVRSQLPEFPVYKLLREAFRGGDTHANRYFTGQIINDMHSADRSSSYPDIVCNCQFPVGPFFLAEGEMDYHELLELIVTRKKAVVCRCEIHNLRLRDPQWPAPYLSRDKCRNILIGKDPEGSWDNGRILRARYLETTITDIDLKIIAKEYTWDYIKFYDVMYARYGPLPDPLIRETIKYYRAKTSLKGVADQEIFYLKSKNKLNSIYGMMAQDPVKRSIVYTQDGKPDQYGYLNYYPEDASKTDQQLLEKHNHNAFLAYQWGCWVTAWARLRLREAIWVVIDQGGEIIYWDTDSTKYLGEVDWTAYNELRIRDSTRSGAWADDPKGTRHFMGVMELEHDILRFRTWGAKKYVHEEIKNGEVVLICTTAGVAKKAGAEELLQAGGLEAYAPGFTFFAAGGLEAIYNDAADLWIEAEGHRLHITPNVSLRPGTYKMGLAGDYDRLLHYYETVDF